MTASHRLLVLLTCIIASSRLAFNHRFHRGLTFCEANPLIRHMNRTKIVELENNEWSAWDDTLLDRVMKISNTLGRGNSLFLTEKWPHHPLHGGDECGFNVAGKNSSGVVAGVVEGINNLVYPMEHLLPCPSPLKRFGEGFQGDTGKLLCEADMLFSLPNCVIYSLGSNNQWEFEKAISDATRTCKVFTFDCTSNPPPSPIPGVQFEKVCMGERNEFKDGRQYHTLSHLMETHGHEAVQLLKMDVEGFEMYVFNEMLTVPFSKKLPYQISVETHCWHFNAAMALQHLALFQRLSMAGYRFVSRENNEQCPSCNEHTLIRVYC